MCSSIWQMGGIHLQGDQHVGATCRKKEQPRDRDVEEQVVVHGAHPRMSYSHRLQGYGALIRCGACLTWIKAGGRPRLSRLREIPYARWSGRGDKRQGTWPFAKWGRRARWRSLDQVSESIRLCLILHCRRCLDRRSTLALPDRAKPERWLME